MLGLHGGYRFSVFLRWFAVAITGMPTLAIAQEMIVYPARCHSLTLFDQPASRRCADTVATIALPDGRTGFAVTIEGISIVTLSGALGSRRTVGDRTTLAIDQVNFVYRGEAEVLPATGTCETDDPTIWHGSIRCEATTPRGRIAFDVSSLGGEGQRVPGMPAAR